MQLVKLGELALVVLLRMPEIFNEIAAAARHQNTETRSKKEKE